VAYKESALSGKVTKKPYWMFGMQAKKSAAKAALK
jgi:hypothetical protein